VFKKDPSQSSVADGVGGHQEALAVVQGGGKDQSKGLVVGRRIERRLGLGISGKGSTGPWG
jgi:hypothetical protein